MYASRKRTGLSFLQVTKLLSVISHVPMRLTSGSATEYEGRMTWLWPLIRDLVCSSEALSSPELHLQGVMEWLCRAQDAAGGGGVARSYSLRWRRAHNKRGWLGAYPETTGYIIPTFFNYARLTGDMTYSERAVRMAAWEIEVQMECGAVQGGTVEFPPSPAVFNTGQVLFGWIRAYEVTGEDRFLLAATRAADFLLDAQDLDGSWHQHGSQFARTGVNLYDARSAWGLAEVYRIRKAAKYRDAAVRNLEFVCRRQQANGWFPDCCLDDNSRPLLHTIAYTIEGLLEAGVVLNEQRFITAARTSAEALLRRHQKNGSLYGRYDSDWLPAASWHCLTGEAQTALVWLRFYQLTGDASFLLAARDRNRFLMTTQDLVSEIPGVRGGIKGSHPIWQEYGPFEFLNWAAKFFADSLSLELSIRRAEGPS